MAKRGGHRQRHYEFAVIGGGVVGTAIARDLTRRTRSVVLIEAAPDLGAGTSKANTAILHTGFDAPVDSLEAQLLRRGYQLMHEQRDGLGIAYEDVGAVLVAWDEEQRSALAGIQARAAANGVTDLDALDARQLYRMEPQLAAGAVAALHVPGEGIVCPFTPPLAFAREAVANGAEVITSAPVTGVHAGDQRYVLQIGRGAVSCGWIVNAAGLYADQIDRMFGFDRFRVTPRRGELVVFDKFARQLVRHIILPVPTARTKGVLISPTVFGNVLLGPTADDLNDKTDTATTAPGLANLLAHGQRLLPALVSEEVTACYAGLRAATEHHDYQIHCHPEQRYVCVGGIRSTGLSASLGIAEYVAAQIAVAAGEAKPPQQWRSVVSPYIGEQRPRPYLDHTAIRANPDYGRLVCHCEKVSRGELLDALRGPLPAVDLDGLRRRTRATLGRCQGFHCQAAIHGLLHGSGAGGATVPMSQPDG